MESIPSNEFLGPLIFFKRFSGFNERKKRGTDIISQKKGLCLACEKFVGGGREFF